MKIKNPKRYKQWRVEDLVPMTREAHISLHHTGKQISDTARQNMSKAQKGNKNALGMKLTEEQIIKLKLSRQDKHYFNNGQICVLSKECPGEGWIKGRLKRVK